MFDYYGVIRKADSISSQASNLRIQAGNVNGLKGIVGYQYSGKDAQAYSSAVVNVRDELYSIANELDSIASRIRSVAKTIRDSEAETSSQ